MCKRIVARLVGDPLQFHQRRHQLRIASRLPSIGAAEAGSTVSTRVLVLSRWLRESMADFLIGARGGDERAGLAAIFAVVSSPAIVVGGGVLNLECVCPLGFV